MAESQPAQLFTGDRSALFGLDPNSAIQGLEAENHVVYHDALGKASNAAVERGDPQAAAAFAFLSILAGFSESFDTPQAPFAAFMELDNRRSPIPSDLTDDDVAALKILAPKISDPALRARLHDVLWVRVKDVAAGQEAARSYVGAGKLQDNNEDWTDAVRSFKRGLHLAAAFGRDKLLFRETVEAVEAAAKAAAIATDGYRALMLTRVLFDGRSGEPSVHAALLAGIAAQAEESGDLRRASEYRDHEAEWHLAAGDQTAAKAARLAGAEAAVKSAETRATSQDKSALAASALLTEAIEKLRRASAPKARVDAARQRLAELQQASLAEMKSFDVPLDISSSVEKARQHVHSENFREALARLATGAHLVEPADLRAQVLSTAKEFPVSHLFQKAQVDHKGRTTVVQEAVLGGKVEDKEAAVQAQMFAHVQIEWAVRVQAFITPARQQILNDHFPGFTDLAFLVRNHPFVPPGHEGIVLRGLHAGFHGDFVVASHLLTPQIENSLRYLLENHGVDVSIFKSDGTQPVKILGGLLDLPETKRILGEAMVFELRGCLIEKTGFDFRNRVAHGFVSEAQCYSPAAILVWWHVLSLCLWPHLLINAADDGGA